MKTCRRQSNCPSLSPLKSPPSSRSRLRAVYKTIREERKQKKRQQHVSSARDGLASRSAKLTALPGGVCELKIDM